MQEYLNNFLETPPALEGEKLYVLTAQRYTQILMGDEDYSGRN
jgi:hypothetical protein